MLAFLLLLYNSMQRRKYERLVQKLIEKLYNYREGDIYLYSHMQLLRKA